MNKIKNSKKSIIHSSQSSLFSGVIQNIYENLQRGLSGGSALLKSNINIFNNNNIYYLKKKIYIYIYLIYF